jgi:TPR repeat protein
MAIGYLIGPLVEKRWADSPPASQSQMHDRNVQAKSLADLRTLADRGDAEAQYQMGVRYDEGDSVPKDDAQAVQWFQHAAEQGQVDAQAHLGAYYWAGRGVPEDLSKAYMWSMIAVAGGDENSKSRLEGLASQMTRAQVSAARQQAEEWIRIHSQQAKSEAN